MRGRAVTLRVWAAVMPCEMTFRDYDTVHSLLRRIPDPGFDVDQALEEEDHARRIRAESHGRHTRA